MPLSRIPRLAAALLSLLSLVSLFSSAAEAATTIPLAVTVKLQPEAPFQLSVLASNLVKQPDGTFSLVLKYAVKNTGFEPLAVQGWSLTVHPASGLARAVHQAFAVDLSPGKTGTYVYTLDEKSIGKLDPRDLVAMQATTGTGRTWCTGGMRTCEQAQVACEAYCSNPLVGTRSGVRNFSCSGCETRYYAPEKCYYQVCNSICECEEVLDPLGHGYVDWEDL